MKCQMVKMRDTGIRIFGSVVAISEQMPPGTVAVIDTRRQLAVIFENVGKKETANAVGL
jgi:hypothetical protein